MATSRAYAAKDNRDINGLTRGNCNACGVCPGFVQPEFPNTHGHHDLIMYCLACGCGCHEHSEEVRHNKYNGSMR